MWRYAKIDDDNLVLWVINIDDQDGQDEPTGEDLCQRLTETSERWIKGNQSRHTPSNQIRKNSPNVGDTFDEGRDAFIPPQPFPSWVLNEDTCGWEAPTPMPDNGNVHLWDEDTISWIDLDIPVPS